ncbi:MAG: ArnT family glycosyltransferase [Kiritimatiellia bacterium]
MRRPALWHLFLLGALLWGGEYLRRDLWEPDEARYAYVAREMAQDGHWLVPHRSGEYYAHKPPLLFWLINLASRATTLPIGRLPVRLPGFFAGILALWATARLAGRWAGEKAAWPSILTLCTAYLFWHEIGFSRMDGPLLGWTMGALALLFLNDDAPSLWRPALAWSCMGLGILTKGPVGLLVPAGAYAAARLAAGEGRLLKKSHWLWGPMIALSLPALWLGLAWLQGAPDGYFRELLFSQNVDRAVGGDIGSGHVRPLYYFLTTVPADLLPWTFCLPAAALVLFQDSTRRLLLRRLGGWIGFVFVFFSLIASKRNIYVLGLFPAAAILVGSVWTELDSAEFRWARFARGAFLLLLSVAGPALLIAGFVPQLPIPGWTLWPAGGAATAGAVVLWRETRRAAAPPRFFLGAAISLLAVQWAVGCFIYPAVNPLKTPVELARAVQERLPPDRPLLIYKINGEILAFYSNRRGEVLRTPEALHAAMAREQRGFVVFQKRMFDAWPADAPRPLGKTREFRSGSRNYVWLEFDLAEPAGKAGST